MSKKTFNIGDRIRVKAYSEMPADGRTRAVGRLCGRIGTVTDKLFSNGTQDFVYTIKFDDFNVESRKMWCADMLEAYSDETAKYDFDFSIQGDRVIVTVSKEGEKVESGFSYIRYDGTYGIVQAASYALCITASKMKEAQSNEEN